MNEQPMRRMMIAAAVALMARAAVAGPAAPSAPAVEWRDAGGAVVRMADAKGKVALVDFWASWCPPCKESFPALDVIQRDYRARGVQVIAVNVDEQQKDADRFLAAHPHQLLVVFDPMGASPKAFKVRGMPSSFVIDRQGDIRYTHQGYSQGIDATYRRELDALLAEPVR
jgi:cytochrome c biogenesis protein CcmG/thiol:disulfide interchange protein DsbE